MKNNISRFASKSTLKTVGTVSEFLNTLKKENYTLVVEDDKIAKIGKNDRPEITFVNQEGKKVLLKTSKNLWDRFLKGDEIDINVLPIYDLGVDGLPELVIGLTGLEDFKSVPENISRNELSELLTRFKKISNLQSKI